MKKRFVLAALLLVSAAVHAEETYLHELAAADPNHPDLVLGKAVGWISAVAGSGTGFLVAPNKILSNRHVIGDVGKTHFPVLMAKHETDGPIHGYITEVIFASGEYDMAVGVVNWTLPDFAAPAPLTLISSSEFDSLVQLAKGKVRIKSIGHSGGRPKIRQIGDYVTHNNWVVGHYPRHAGGGSGSPVFFENGNAVVGVATDTDEWTVSRLFHDQPDDYFHKLTAVITAPLDPTSPTILAGHTSGAKSAVYSPNGQAIAVGGADGAIRIYNAVWSGVPRAPIHTLQGHTSAVNSVAYSPNGQAIASGGGNTVRVWNVNTGAPIRTLQAHTSHVLSAAYSPDGQTLAAGSADAKIRLWSANTGEPRGILQGRHTAAVNSVAYSPDGLTIASGSADNTIRLWNAKTGAHIRALEGHTGDVASVAYSPDGLTIASGSGNIDNDSGDNTIRLWDANTGRHIRTLEGHTSDVLSAAYSPDGLTIASGSMDNTIRIWNAKTGEPIQTIEGHAADVWSAAYSPDGLTIASASDDSTIRIWNIPNRPTATVSGPSAAQAGAFDVQISFSAPVAGFTLSDIVVTNGSAANFAGSGKSYTATIEPSSIGAVTVSVPADAASNFWGSSEASNAYSVNITRPTATVSGPSESQAGAFDVQISFSAAVTGFTLSDIVATNGSAINLAGSGASYTATIEPSSPGVVTVSVPADAAASVRGNNKASNIYSADYRAQQVLTGHEHDVFTVAYSPNGQTIASASADRTIRIWNAATGAPIQIIEGYTDEIRSVAYSPDSQRIASANDDRTIRIWNFNTGKHLPPLLGNTEKVWSVTYSPDGQTIASGGGDRTIRIWNADTGKPIRTLEGHGAAVWSVAYSPDSQTIVSGSGDRTIRIWNADTGEPMGIFQGLHTAAVWSVAYSPDGLTIASGGGDDTVRIWNAKTGAPIRTLEGHTDSVQSVAYSPNGQTIASGGADRTVRIWNAKTGASIQTLRGHTDWVLSVAYSPDGQTVVSGSYDDSVRIWDISDIADPTTRPTVIVSGPTEAQAGAFHVKIVFSSAVTGFTSSDIAATNGSATNLVGGGASYAATIEPSGAGVVTVSVPANAAGNNEASNTYSVNIARSSSFTVNLRQGINMLHVPVNDPSLEKLSDLYAALGGSQDVQFLLAYSPESNLFKAYTEGLAGSDLPLSDETAVLVSMKSAKSVTFTGGLLKREVSLRAGMNLIGVTRAGAVETIGDLASLTTVQLTVIALKHDDTGNALFILANDSTDAAKGGEGYIILAAAETVLTFDGSAWSNDGATGAASAEAVAYDPSATPLLVAEGSVAREDNLAPLNGLEVSIANLQNGQTASDIAGRGSASGRFSLPLLALTGDSYAIGDAFDLRVVDSSGTFGVQSVRVVLDKESVSSGRIDIGKLLATAVPTESALLLPNYPNPFNPETWIPFELAESSRVTITIYNAAGQTVRALELGQLPAGTYRSRSRSAHWDGRNALGEPVASGIYFVRIEAGSFMALRRMVVLK